MDAARPSPFNTGSLSRPQGEGRDSKLPRIGFVATNSITQGEQVAQLWPLLFDRYGLEIAFAHRTFAWMSDARGKAHVHCVIIGLTRRDDEPKEKRLFSYDDIKGDAMESRHAACRPISSTRAACQRDIPLFVTRVCRLLTFLHYEWGQSLLTMDIISSTKNRRQSLKSANRIPPPSSLRSGRRNSSTGQRDGYCDWKLCHRKNFDQCLSSWK